MTDDVDDSSEGGFFSAGIGYGGSGQGLPDVTGMTVSISGDVPNPGQFFSTSIARHHAALDAYVAALETADLDVTDDRVIAASSDLHNSLTTLAIAHTAYAGSGFPSPLYGEERGSRVASKPQPKSMPRVNPALHTAITGTLSQRLSVSDLTPIPLEAQLVLAKDPHDGIRSGLLMGDYLDRATVLLMERDETDPGIRERLGEQLYSTVESKRAASLFSMRYEVIEMGCEQLGLSKANFKRVWKARMKLEDDGDFTTTFGEVLDQLGLGTD